MPRSELRSTEEHAKIFLLAFIPHAPGGSTEETVIFQSRKIWGNEGRPRNMEYSFGMLYPIQMVDRGNVNCPVRENPGNVGSTEETLIVRCGKAVGDRGKADGLNAVKR